MLKLPGIKVLVKGNHDKKSSMAYMEAGFALATEEIRMKLEGVDILFSHHPVPEHTADINIHGHLHCLYREDMTRLYLPLSLEHMGYQPIAVDREFLQKIRSWVDRQHIPSIKEIIALRQNYIGKPTDNDRHGKHYRKDNKARGET